jgi:hypothetical protein
MIIDQMMRARTENAVKMKNDGFKYSSKAAPSPHHMAMRPGSGRGLTANRAHIPVKIPRPTT